MKANLATIDKDSPRTVLVECLNRAEDMRSVAVLYVTNEGEGEVTLLRSAIAVDMLTMLGLLSRVVGRME